MSTEPEVRQGPSRVLGWVLTLVGAGVCALTWGVQNGFVHGVTAEWPAYLVGGAMIVFGVKALAWRAPPPAPLETGPVRESGLEDGDVAEAEAMDMDARLRARARAAAPPDRPGH